MIAPSFDPTRAVRFDLAQGSVKTGGDAESVLLVPSAALDELALSVPAEAVEALGRALGTAIGRRVALRLDDPKGASVEAFVTQLAGESALTGVGALSVERWGHALVVVVERSPLASVLLVPLVAAAVEATFARQVYATLLARDERSARVLIASRSAADRVRDAIASGTPWGEALTSLHGARA
jgi:hypothetical protein